MSADSDETGEPLAQEFRVSVRALCEFAARRGDLDLRFTPGPSAQQGREGHLLVAQARGPDHEAELALYGQYQALHVRGRADGYDPNEHRLEEVKTFRGRLETVGANQRLLHWAQLKVYGWLLCERRALSGVKLCLVYFDIDARTEHPFIEEHGRADLKRFFESLCEPYLNWCRQEAAHRGARDAALSELSFPQAPFRTGQRRLAAGVYRDHYIVSINNGSRACWCRLRPASARP